MKEKFTDKSLDYLFATDDSGSEEGWVDEKWGWTQVVWISWNPTGTGRAVSLLR